MHHVESGLGSCCELLHKKLGCVTYASIYIYMHIYIYIYYYLRRGGTKASACFLTRAGARETPPHPYGMAQT